MSSLRDYHRRNEIVDGSWSPPAQTSLTATRAPAGECMFELCERVALVQSAFTRSQEGSLN